jgi:hypothetical protein
LIFLSSEDLGDFGFSQILGVLGFLMSSRDGDSVFPLSERASKEIVIGAQERRVYRHSG